MALLQVQRCHANFGAKITIPTPFSFRQRDNKKNGDVVVVVGRKKSRCVVVEAKSGKRNRLGNRRPPMPSIPPPEDDNPRFLLFVRSKKVPIWYPLSIISGGSTAKLMVAAKDTPIGKSMFESTLTRNIAAVVYADEKGIRRTAVSQFPVLKEALELEYGYKLIDPKNPNSALMLSDVIKIPPQEELKPVVEKVKDFFGTAFKGVQESIGSISTSSSQDK